MCLKRKAIAQLQEGLPCGNEELVFRILHFVTGSEIWIQFSLSNTAWAKQNTCRVHLENVRLKAPAASLCLCSPLFPEVIRTW